RCPPDSDCFPSRCPHFYFFIFFSCSVAYPSLHFSLHDALPISFDPLKRPATPEVKDRNWPKNPIDYFTLARLEAEGLKPSFEARSEEHTSELQSLRHLVCRLLLEKKKTKK